MTATISQPSPSRARAPAPAPRAPIPAADRWLITLFLLVLLAPPEAQFRLGSLLLSPQRIMVFVGLPWAALRIIGDRRLRLRGLDAVALLHAAWVWVALAQRHGVNAGTIESAGSYTLEWLGSYSIGRALTTTPSHLVFFSRRLFQFVIAIGLLAIPEMLTGRHFIREAFGMLFGPRSLAGVEDRLGLTRAFGPFDHPILYGVFCASALGLIWYTAPARGVLAFGRLWRAAATVIAAFASLSTGPLMACTVQMGLIAWDVASRSFRARWWILLAGFLAAYIAVDALSNRDPITVFISYATFNPRTGYDRKLIWDIGMDQIRLTPIFGIGMDVWTTAPEWWHNTSVDNFWLLTALRYGIPGVLTLLIIALTTIVGVIRLRAREVRPVAMGWLVSFGGLSIAAITVHLWGSAFLLFGYLLGAGVSLTRLRAAAQRPPVSEPPYSAEPT